MHSSYISVAIALICLRHSVGNAQGEAKLCGDPPVVQNATRSPNEEGPFPLGTVISYTCGRGYITEGRLNTAECFLDERTGNAAWAAPSIYCRPQSCGDPGYVNNAQRVGSLFIFPHSVEYICKEGYKLMGRNKRYCQPTGTWTGRLPECKIVSCPSPKNIKNGEAVYESIEYGSTLEYKCDRGYRLEGNPILECRENGTWSWGPPVCIRVECPLLRKPTNGTMIVPSDTLTVDSIISFTCNPGMDMIGSRVTKCQPSGEWTFDPPSCVLPCELPYLYHGHFGNYESKFIWKKLKYVPRFKRIHGNHKLKEGESVILRCDSNYEALGEDQSESLVVCEKSKLEPTPFCHPVKCRISPPTPRNGILIEYGKEHKSVPAYECNSDFKKITEGSVRCNFGSWIGDPPICINTLCYSLALKDLGFHLDEKKVYRSGESVRVNCLRGYEEAGGSNQNIICIDGVWKMSNSQPCKPARCITEPPKSPNLIARYSDTTHGTYIEYECEQGYRVNSSFFEVKCDYGQWKGIPPTCKDTRCYPDQLRDVEGLRLQALGPVDHSARVNITCKKGYVVNRSNLLCFDGRFHGAKNKPCIPDVGTLSSPSRFNLEKNEERHSTSPTKLPNHQTTMVTNSSKTFTSTEPTVYNSTDSTNVYFSKENATDLDSEDHLSNTTDVNREDTRPTPSHALIENITMKSCHVNVEDRFLQMYLDDYKVEYGSNVPHGKTVKFHCSNIGFYRLNGHKEISCDNGIWRPPSFPFCANPAKGDIIISYHTVPENNFKVTSDGVLSITPGTEVYLISWLLDVYDFPVWEVTPARNLFIDYLNDERNNKAITSLIIKDACAENTKNYTAASRNGFRFTISVEVKEPKCPRLHLTRNLTVKYLPDREYQGVASFRCPHLWHLEGPHNITCLKSGEWSSPPPECRYFQCPEINASVELSIQYIPNRHSGGIANFQCPPATDIEGPVNITCLPSGWWSASPPSCKKVECNVLQLVDLLPDYIVFDWTEEYFTVSSGFQLELICNKDGHVISGDSKVTCSHRGEWLLGKPYCKQGCGPIKKAKNSTLIISNEKDHYKFGEHIIFSCPEGQLLKPNIQRVVCIGAPWSQIPDCQTV